MRTSIMFAMAAAITVAAVAPEETSANSASPHEKAKPSVSVGSPTWVSRTARSYRRSRTRRVAARERSAPISVALPRRGEGSGTHDELRPVAAAPSR